MKISKYSIREVETIEKRPHGLIWYNQAEGYAYRKDIRGAEFKVDLDDGLYVSEEGEVIEKDQVRITFVNGGFVSKYFDNESLAQTYFMDLCAKLDLITV